MADLAHSVKTHKKLKPNLSNSRYEYDNYHQKVDKALLPKFVKNQARESGFRSSKIQGNAKFQNIHQPSSDAYNNPNKHVNRSLRKNKHY
jgi:hypothetical protein